MKKSDHVWLVERNIHGAWVIYGSLGIRQYYYYTKTDAIRLYMQDVRKTIIE